MDSKEEQLQKDLSAYFSELGKRAGEVNKKKGSAYFKWVRSLGKKRPVKNKNTTTSDGR